MKIILLFILVFPLYLSSNEIKVTSDYENGLTYYQNNEFEQSYNIFLKIYLEHLSDVEFNFSFGRSAYETGHYEMAIAAFERVEMQDSSNLRNRLEMARTYFMLKMYEDSQNAFKDVLASQDIPKNIRTNIELSLSRVSKVQQKSFTYTQLMMGVLYDSNVNYGSIADYEYGGGTLGKIPEKSDIALEAYANISNIYDIGSKNGFAIKNSLDLYVKEYLSENDYSILYLNYSPSILYKETKYTTELAVNFDILAMGRTKYLTSIALKPTLQYNHTTTLNSIIYFKYQMKDFVDDSLDASRYELTYALQNILSPRSYIQGNIFLINETKKDGTNIYVDFNEYKLSTSYVKQFAQIYSLDLYAQARLRDYKDFSVGFNSIREDIAGLVNINFSAILIPTLNASTKLSYEYVQSNQDRFSYQKYTAFIGLVKTF